MICLSRVLPPERFRRQFCFHILSDLSFGINLPLVFEPLPFRLEQLLRWKRAKPREPFAINLNGYGTFWEAGKSQFSHWIIG